ncbi:MAG: exopolyphosphatase [Desulfobacterales bacterium]|nr:exopolyphosphatase [Desulfobacterales bacterium]
MRIVTRPDFDGIVCAVLINDVEHITESILWVEPNDMQNKRVTIQPGDIIANLPYHDDCSLWFDHHYTNEIHKPFQGCFQIAPSAAGIVYHYYKDKLHFDFTELVAAADKIDAAQLSQDEVLHPENDPYILLSMTIVSHEKSDEPYWNKLVYLFKQGSIQEVMSDTEVIDRFQKTIHQNNQYTDILKQHTKLIGHVSVTDFRSFENVPRGNRFLSYSLFPESVVNVRIRYDEHNKEKVIVSVGHSIFNRHCHVNIGQLLTQFNGGGHSAAGACNFHKSFADTYIPALIDVLVKNNPI